MKELQDVTLYNVYTNNGDCPIQSQLCIALKTKDGCLKLLYKDTNTDAIKQWLTTSIKKANNVSDDYKIIYTKNSKYILSKSSSIFDELCRMHIESVNTNNLLQILNLIS